MLRKIGKILISKKRGLSEEFSDEDLSAVLPALHNSHLENTHFV